jgi:hypothetical protein
VPGRHGEPTGVMIVGVDSCVDVMMQAGDGGDVLDVRCWLRPPCSLACQLRATYLPQPSATAAASKACLHIKMEGFMRAVDVQAVGAHACPQYGRVQCVPMNAPQRRGTMPMHRN